jgi:uncharacterized protein YbjT (DUF2867 family)
MTVLVSGASGTSGGEVLRQLRAGGVAVRAMTRWAEAAEALRATGVDAMIADLADRASLASALDGIDAVYVATNASPELPAQEGNLARAAAAAGVRHLVKLSVIGASADSSLTFARLHHAAEAEIRASGVPAIFVRPNGFMQNTLAWKGQLEEGVIRGPVPDARWSIVDVRDVAAVAVAALQDPAAHAGESYTVTGPESSSPREQVAILADVLGRELRVEELPVGAAVDWLRSVGVPDWTAERLGELWEFYAAGGAQAVSPDVARVTGRTPCDFARFAREVFAAG